MAQATSTSTPLRLLRTPSPHKNESLAGYLLRLSEKNYYDTPNWILHLAGYRANQKIQWNLNEEPPSDLSQLTGVEEEVLKSMAFGMTEKDKILSYGIYKGATQLCPDCLKESLYSRLLWDLPMNRICPLHQCKLINTCPQCRQLIRWSRPGVAKCQSGFDFRDCQATAATEAQVNFSFYLHGSFGQVEYLNAVKAIYQPDNPVFQLTLTQFSRLSSFLGSYVRVYWRHQRCIALAKIAFTEFDSELEELFKVELVFDFFKEWENHVSKLLQWHEKNLQPRTSQLKTISSMVYFLVEFSNYFPVRSSIAVWLESYLIEFLSRYGFDQIEIIWTHPVYTHSRAFKLKEVQHWLPKMAQTWNEVELSLARLILASPDPWYLFPSDINPTGLMILRNPVPQILKVKAGI